MKEHLRKNRRDFYEFLDDNSIAIIYSGNEVHKSPGKFVLLYGDGT